jgi:hypothetical protein
MTITVDEWGLIWGDGADAAERDRLLRVACGALEELLGRVPDAADEIDRVFAENLVDPINTDTWSPIDRFLMLYVGSDVRYLIAWTALRPEERLPMLESAGSPGAATFMRSLVARYDPAIGDAYLAWRELPDNWRKINRNYVIDGERGKLVRVTVSTYGGASFGVEGPLHALMNLTSYLLDTLMESDVTEYKDDAVVSQFRTTVAATADWANATTPDAAPGGGKEA